MTIAPQKAPESGVAAALSIRTGTQLWQTKLPELAGWIPSDTTVTDQRLYVVLNRSPRADEPAPVRVVALDLASGRVLGDHQLSVRAGNFASSIVADANSVVVDAGGQLIALG